MLPFPHVSKWFSYTVTKEIVSEFQHISTLGCGEGTSYSSLCVVDKIWKNLILTWPQGCRPFLTGIWYNTDQYLLMIHLLMIHRAHPCNSYEFYVSYYFSDL